MFFDKKSVRLRVLGYPNPGQSFGRGMCGPEATGVKLWSSVLGQRKCEEKKQKSWWMCRFCRLRDGTISGARMAGTFRFVKFAIFLKKFIFFRKSKSWRMCRFLPPPGRHHFGSPHGRYPQICEIHWFFKKTWKKLKSWNSDGCVDFYRLRDSIISGCRMAGTFRFLQSIDFSKKV